MNDIRPGEVAVETPSGADAGVWFIGRIRTPWRSRKETPRQGALDGPVCRIEVFSPWDRGLDATSEWEHLQVLYWLHEARRDLVRQSPKSDGRTRGVFSLRSPVRPNPIGSSIVKLERIEGSTLFVRGLDCLDGTPLVDIKPERCAYSPPASAQA